MKIRSIYDATRVLRLYRDVTVGNLRIFMKGGKWYSDLAGSVVELWDEGVAARQLWHSRGAWNKLQKVQP